MKQVEPYHGSKVPKGDRYTAGHNAEDEAASTAAVKIMRIFLVFIMSNLIPDKIGTGKNYTL